MKGFGKDIAIAFLLGVVIPAVAIQAAVLHRAAAQSKSTPVLMEESEDQTESVRNFREIRFREKGGEVSSMDLEAYLVGAVLGEMPADFEPEALKAQAVAARTYAWKVYSTGIKHGDGSVCTDAACCQAYCSPKEYLEKGGALASVEKIRAAVLDTANLVLTYEGTLIEATYFSCSGGKTEDAVAVWGNDFPYLQSVESPGEEASAYYEDTVIFTREQLESALGVSLGEDASGWFGEPTYTEGDGVETIRIGTELFSGIELRRLLGLRSTAFQVDFDGDTAVFATRGYGHRVGMSQYGADAMAADGADYRMILAHYYSGTELTTLE